MASALSDLLQDLRRMPSVDTNKINQAIWEYSDLLRTTEKQTQQLGLLSDQLRELDQKLNQVCYARGGPGYFEALKSFSQTGGQVRLGTYPSAGGHTICFRLGRSVAGVEPAAIFVTGSFIDWSQGYQLINLKEDIWFIELDDLKCGDEYKFYLLDSLGRKTWFIDYNSPYTNGGAPALANNVVQLSFWDDSKKEAACAWGQTYLEDGSWVLKTTFNPTEISVERLTVEVVLFPSRRRFQMVNPTENIWVVHVAAEYLVGNTCFKLNHSNVNWKQSGYVLDSHSPTVTDSAGHINNRLLNH